LFSGEGGSAATVSTLLERGLPERFEATALLHLFDLSLRTGQFDGAWSYLHQIKLRHASTTTESGLPARLLAVWRWLRLPPSASRGAWKADVEWLCAYAVLEPGPLSDAILDDVRRFVSDGALAQSTRAWDIVWEAHQQSRKLAESLRDAHATQPADARVTVTGWTELGDREILLVSQRANHGIWWLAWPESVLATNIHRTLKTAKIPPHLGCSVAVGGRTLTAATPAARPLAFSTASVDRSTGPELTATVWLSDPDLLYARQRKRTWWFGALIAVSAAAVLCGVMAAWRGFREQQRLTEMKSSFVSSVSHEMRAPIASVRLMAEELVDRGTSDPTKAGEYHGYILQECRRLSALIENVLDFSRHEQGRKQYRFESTDLVPVVDQTIHVMRSYAADRKVTIERRLDGVPFDLDLDAAAIQQVLVNLLDNAIKHSPSGATVEVALSYPELAPDRESPGHPAANGTPPVRVSVRDEGSGIPAEEQGLIFQRFYRRGTELRRETQGIGLGLAIVQYIIEAHGGKASVESQVGKGSRFIVELPPPGGNRA
jgi:signal transduction histidine kinase